jgi:hypothetical protein
VLVLRFLAGAKVQPKNSAQNVRPAALGNGEETSSHRRFLTDLPVAFERSLGYSMGATKCSLPLKEYSPHR